MIKVEGEPLIHFNNLSVFPGDAKRVLHIRREVAKELRLNGGMGTLVDDLIIEDSRADLKAEGARVAHPIVFMLPNAVLRVIASL